MIIKITFQGSILQKGLLSSPKDLLIIPVLRRRFLTVLSNSLWGMTFLKIGLHKFRPKRWRIKIYKHVTWIKLYLRWLDGPYHPFKRRDIWSPRYPLEEGLIFSPWFWCTLYGTRLTFTFSKPIVIYSDFRVVETNVQTSIENWRSSE